MRPLARCASAILLLLLPLATAPTAAATATAAVPVTVHHSANAVPGHYIVTLRQESQPRSMLQQLRIVPKFTYTTALYGFAAALTPAQLDQVRRAPDVQAIEEDGYVTADSAAAKVPAGPRIPAVSWGLDRIDQRKLPLDGQFDVNSTGKGATAYIVDTGIDFSHPDFGGRAVPGYDAVGDGRDGQDCNGHGTHVAGTVGGSTYGIAHESSLVSVRVLDCQGRGALSGVIAGFEWIAQHAKQPAVLNASLGGPYSDAMNQATDSVARSGVLPVVAAGNSTEDACGVSPASADRALAVGATDQKDTQAPFSNFGPCLSIYAPGVDIVSDKLGGGSLALSGTSMASPHVAGIATLYRAKNPTASAAAVKTWIDGQATAKVLTVSQTSPNRMAYTAGL